MIDLILKANRGAVIGRFSLKCDHVPRMGEMIDLSGLETAMPLKESQYRVLNVIYRCIQQKMIPEVTCRPLTDEQGADLDLIVSPTDTGT